ncbi:hypothetical protein [Methanolapillus ohkumae]
MKTKIYFIGFIFFVSVFAGGCLNINSTSAENKTTDSENPSEQQSAVKYNSSYTTTEFISKKNIPNGTENVYLMTGENVTFMPYTQEGLENSDLIVYATAKEIKPARWTTPTGEQPENLIFFDNPAERKHLAGQANGEKIYTDILFKVDDRAKGNSSDEITVRVFGGQVKDIVFVNYSWPDPWDFQEGGQYLLYLDYREDTSTYKLRAINGVRAVTSNEP